MNPELSQYRFDSREVGKGMTPSVWLEQSLLGSFKMDKRDYNGVKKWWEGANQERKARDLGGMVMVMDKLESVGDPLKATANEWLFLVVGDALANFKTFGEVSDLRPVDEIEEKWRKIEKNSKFAKVDLFRPEAGVKIYGDRSVTDVIADDIVGVLSGSEESLARVGRGLGTTSALVIAAEVMAACTSPLPAMIQTIEANQTKVVSPVPYITLTPGSLSPEVTGTPSPLAPTPKFDPTKITPEVIATATREVTATPDPEMQITTAVSTLGLNKDRTYQIQGGYLVDTFNQAKMAKLDKSEWVDTTLEEKYGELVPKDKVMQSLKVYGNMYIIDYNNESAQVKDRRWESTELVTWSTGNVTAKESFNQALNKNTVDIFGELLFRDKDGVIHLLNVRFDVVDQSNQFSLPICTVSDMDRSKYRSPCGPINPILMSSIDEELAYYRKPGQQTILFFSSKLPEEPPVYKNLGRGFVNTRGLTDYYDWVKNKELYQALADAIENKTALESLPKDFVVASQITGILMTEEEVQKIFAEKK